MSFSFDDFWLAETKFHQDVAEKTFARLGPLLSVWVTESAKVIKNGGKILFCGNGGSAADAQHIAAELSIKLCEPRKAIPALCLSLDPSALTACANDFGYESVFARQIEALGRKGDLLVGLSTSGKSPNIIKAVETARSIGIKTVSLTGENGGPLAPLCDIAIKIPCATSTARIQEMHITLGHIFCGALERELGLVSL
ncbi:MAG: D-sedoheptulose 7-phosphate isomerase [Alphaproteobacteria bacterium]|nr:D-sedoheptulose 7-phosphate isomerase [Alphaproteobacteria bacterium]